MRNISSKADGVGDTLPAGDFNANLRSELQNVVTDAGITLDPEGGADTDLHMLGKAIATYGAAVYYEDSGAANAYALSRVGNLQAQDAYFDGMMAVFIPGNTNTGASTVNINTIGSKSITLPDGTALSGGELRNDQYALLIYDLTNDRFAALNVSNKVLREDKVIYDSGMVDSDTVTAVFGFEPKTISFTYIAQVQDGTNGFWGKTDGVGVITVTGTDTITIDFSYVNGYWHNSDVEFRCVSAHSTALTLKMLSGKTGILAQDYVDGALTWDSSTHTLTITWNETDTVTASNFFAMILHASN